jgi:hypothetical protein
MPPSVNKLVADETRSNHTPNRRIIWSALHRSRWVQRSSFFTTSVTTQLRAVLHLGQNKEDETFISSTSCVLHTDSVWTEYLSQGSDGLRLDTRGLIPSGAREMYVHPGLCQTQGFNLECVALSCAETWTVLLIFTFMPLVLLHGMRRTTESSG